MAPPPLPTGRQALPPLSEPEASRGEVGTTRNRGWGGGDRKINERDYI
jgi:hypothetical protein